MKLLGAAYLIYLGVRAILASRHASIKTQKVRTMNNQQVFRQSIVVELTNPKTALFFLAFLPQFVNSEAGSVAVQLAVLGCLYAFIALINDVFVAMMSGQIANWLKHNKHFVIWQDRVSGSILIALGAFIAIEETQ